MPETAAERVLGGGFVVPEVRPPQRHGQRQRQRDPARQPPVQPDAGGAGADRHHRLAEDDDQQQAVALDEVRGIQFADVLGDRVRGRRS